MRTFRSVRPMFASVLALVLLSGCSGGDSTTPPPTDDTASRPAKVTIAPPVDTLRWITATRQLTAAVMNSTGLALPTTVSWSSSSSGVATVSASGLVTAAGVGTATISAQAGTVSGTATVVVRQDPATITKLSGDSQSGTVDDLLDQPLVVEVRDQGNATVSGAALAWSVTAGDGALETSSTEADASGKGQGTWRLGPTVGGQSVQVTSGTAGPVTFGATAKAPEVDRVELLPAVDTARAVGEEVQFTATAYAAGGAAIAGAAIVYSVTDDAVASISSTGLATAKAEGTTKVIAQAGTKADTATLFVVLPPAGAVTITAVEPSVLVEGQAATIRGSGFASTTAGNQVLIDGLVTTVTSASATELGVTVPVSDCLPARSVVVEVDVGAESATRAASMTPAPIWQLQLGQILYGGRCVHLGAGVGTEKFVMGVLSTSEVPSSLTPATLSANTGVVLQAAPTVEAPSSEVRMMRVEGMSPIQRVSTPGAPVELDRAWFRIQEGRARAEAEWRATELRTVHELKARLGPSPLAVPSRSEGPASVAAVGDTLTFNVPGGESPCTNVVAVRGVVKYVGTGGIWVEDVDNPVEAFTSAEYQSLDDFYSTHTHPTLIQYFGDFADVDGNARTVVLLTKEVNKRSNVLGFAFGGDLVPTTVCAGSNEAEIFYGLVPDPSGVHGAAWTAAEVAERYPSLIAHEIAHVDQLTQYFYGQAGAKHIWELEGGATLAEQLVGFKVMGHSPGQDLGYAAWSAGGGWFSDWPVDLAYYYGYSDAGHIPGAPEQCSWMGLERDGNTGPCYNGRAPYGVPATLLRFMLDRYGPNHPGGEAGLMRTLTGSPDVGLATLANATGAFKENLLALFGIVLWGDGRVGNALTSWNIWDIFSHFKTSAHLQPYTSSEATPALSVSVRAGSNALLEWNPPAGRAPTSLRLRTPSGAALPTHMTIWIWRIQ